VSKILESFVKSMSKNSNPGVVRAGPVAGGQGAEAGAEGAGSASAHTQAQQSLRQVSH
jgi:hypothetical protein